MPDSALVDGCAVRLLVLRSAARADGAVPAWRRPGGDFPARRIIATHSRRWGDGRAPDAGPGHLSRSARRPEAGFLYLYEASVTGTETALLAAAAAHRRLGNPPRRLRAARRRALRVPGKKLGVASPASARRRSGGRAARNSRSAVTRSGATTSKPAAGRSWPRSPAASSPFAARAPGPRLRRRGPGTKRMDRVNVIPAVRGKALDAEGGPAGG